MNILVLLFLVLTFVFPKAGTKVGDVPLYLSIIAAIPVASFVFCKKLVLFLQAKRSSFFSIFLILLIYLILDLFIDTLLSYNCLSKRFVLYVSAIVSLIFLVLVYFQEVFKISLRNWIRVISFSFWFLTLYGLAQKIFGDYTVVVPGLTAAYSEAIKSNFLAQKDNVIWGLNYIKLTSTYQNGNLFGVNYILISWFYFHFLHEFKEKSKLMLSILLYVVVCILTASATVIIGCLFSLLLFLVFKKMVSVRYILFICSVILIVIIIFTWTNNILLELIKYRLLERDVYQMGGRLPSLVEYLKNLNLEAFLLGGSLLCLKGGAYEITIMAVFYFFGMLSIPLFLLFLIGILRYISLQDIFSIGILTYLLMSFSDGAFWLPPTAINFSVLLSLAMYLSKFTKYSVKGNS